MTWTYDNAPGSSTAEERRDAVRFAVGDTDADNPLVSDEEIAFALSETGDNVNRAVAIVARSLAAKYSREADVKIDGFSESFRDISDRFMSIAASYEQRDRLGSGGLGLPRVGGTRRSNMENAENDLDRVKPAFRRGQFDNTRD